MVHDGLFLLLLTLFRQTLEVTGANDITKILISRQHEAMYDNKN